MEHSMIHVPERPRLRPYYHVVPLASDRVQLRSAHRTVALQGPGATALARQVLPLLDGSRGVDEIARESGFTLTAITDALRLLHDKHLLEDAVAVARAESVLSKDELHAYGDQLVLFSTMVSDAHQAQAVLRDRRVTVIGFAGLTIASARHILASGIGELTMVLTSDEHDADSSLAASLQSENPRARIHVMHRSGEELDRELMRTLCTGQDMIVVCNDGPSRAICEAANDIALELERPWLPVTIFGNDVAVGPLIVPRQTACFVCYQARMAANLAFSDEYIAFQEHVTRSEMKATRQGGMRPYAAIVGGLAAIEVVKFLSSVAYPPTFGRLLRLNLANYELFVQAVLRLPRCPACGIGGPVDREWQS